MSNPMVCTNCGKVSARKLGWLQRLIYYSMCEKCGGILEKQKSDQLTEDSDA